MLLKSLEKVNWLEDPIISDIFSYFWSSPELYVLKYYEVFHKIWNTWLVIFIHALSFVRNYENNLEVKLDNVKWDQVRLSKWLHIPLSLKSRSNLAQLFPDGRSPIDE